MKTWKTAAVTRGCRRGGRDRLAVAPPIQGQTRVTPKVRALEMLSGGSRIGVSIRDVEDSDSKTAKGAATGVIVEEVATESPAEKAGDSQGRRHRGVRWRAGPQRPAADPAGAGNARGQDRAGGPPA